MKDILNIKPCIIFFTGLSASGKSTLSRALQDKFKKLNITNVVNLDGDLFRKKIKDFNYKNKSRNKIGDLKIKLGTKYKLQGNIVLISGIAHDKSWRNKTKKNTKDYFEIFLKCSLKTCQKRDFKKQYTKAKKGIIKNFVGIHEAYEVGKSHDLSINTDRLSKVKSVNNIITFLKKKNSSEI
jgi:adenylylsulfate kinase-like enzyme